MSVKNEGEALMYLIDCTLATVCHMAMLKSRKKGEYQRQIRIAEKGLGWAKAFGVPLTSRAKDVEEKHDGSVVEWAKRYEI